MCLPRFLLLACCLSTVTELSATRVLEQREDAYEVQLGEVILPRSLAGTVIFKPCSECETVALRVSGQTFYSIDGHPIALEDLAQAVEEIRQTNGGNSRTLVYVFFEPQSKRVTRLALDRMERVQP